MNPTTSPTAAGAPANSHAWTRRQSLIAAACIAAVTVAGFVAYTVNESQSAARMESAGADWDYFQASYAYVIAHPGSGDHIPTKRPDSWKRGDRLPYQDRQVMPR